MSLGVIATVTVTLTQPQEPLVRMCTEPSPDVFSVFAQSLSAGGRFGQTGAKQIEAAASFALATAEQGSTIQRTQTVNLLKEVMYRTCERFLNGQIGASELAIQAVRDQRMIVSTLAIEQLTGMASPGAVIIGAKGGASGGASTASSVALIAAAQKKRTETDAAYKLLEDTAPSCTDVGKLTETELADAANVAKKKKKAGCEATADAKTTAAKDLAALEKAAGDGSTPVSVTTDTGSSTGSPTNNRADAQSIAEVSESVWKIVEANFKQDEFLLFCMRTIDGKQYFDPEIKAACIVHIQTGLQTEAIRSRAAVVEYNRVLAAQTAPIDAALDKFWSRVASAGDPNFADPAKLKTVLDAYLKANPSFYGRAKVQSMLGLTTKDEFFDLFSGLPDEVQNDLAK
jgi:hypothetical protein